MPVLRTDLPGSKASLRVDEGRHQSVASELLAAVASLSFTAASSVKQVQLDYTNLQGCGSACLEESLKVICNPFVLQCLQLLHLSLSTDGVDLF